MNNLKIKNLTIFVIGISVGLIYTISWLFNLNLGNFLDLWESVQKTLAIFPFILIWFVKWGWKCVCFKNWLVPFPDLTGTWMGDINSAWEDPKTGRLDLIPAMLVIKQSFINLSCVMSTAKGKSFSYAAGFQIDPENQKKRLIFTYTKQTKLLFSKSNPPHDGTGVFDILEKPERKLAGNYWTSNNTIGEIQFKFLKKELLEEIPSDTPAHPRIANNQ